MYVLIRDGKILAEYPDMPFSVTLPDGYVRTSLSELSDEKLAGLGLVYYADVIPEYDPELQRWSGKYIYDKKAMTATHEIIDIDLSEVKSAKLAQLQIVLQAQQASGFTSSSGIKVATEEKDLLAFTQLMAGLLAFQPPQVQIRDYDGVTHTMSLADAKQLLGEIFIYGQSLYAQKWAATDAINAAATGADVKAVSL